MTISGKGVETLEKSFFVITGDAMIPYHRIAPVRYDGKDVFVRKR